MKIRSNFKDYYDGMAAYDDGYNTMFFRKTSKPQPIDLGIKIPHFSSCGMRWDRMQHTSYHGVLLGFAGDIWPIMKVIKPDGRVVMDYDANKAINTYFGAWLKPDYYDFFFPNKINHVEMFEKYGPIWVVKCEDEHAHRPRFEIISNPRLLDYGFQKVIPANLAFDQLNRFICNTRNPPMPIPEMSNDIKIEQHGFDLKTSFRRAKSKKNG